MLKDMEHKPVLLKEVLKTFSTVSVDKWIIDTTLGLGGHFLNLLKNHTQLFGIDADEHSIEYVKKQLLAKGFVQKAPGEYIKNKKRAILQKGNFSQLPELLSKWSINEYDVGGLLADLGISMYHIKSSGRGFSFAKLKEPLDMRIDISTGYTASQLLSFLSKKELEELFKNLADVSNARVLAQRIVKYRKKARILTVGDLLKALNLPVKKPAGLRIHPATKIFMALRIAVNKEHLNLKTFLNYAKNYLDSGSLLDVITFHSLEEETVKNFIQENSYTYKVFLPSEEELKENKSARSAKLYVIQNEAKK